MQKPQISTNYTNFLNKPLYNNVRQDTLSFLPALYRTNQITIRDKYLLSKTSCHPKN